VCNICIVTNTATVLVHGIGHNLCGCLASDTDVERAAALKDLSLHVIDV
jgi:hypothetical protein